MHEAQPLQVKRIKIRKSKLYYTFGYIKNNYYFILFIYNKLTNIYLHIRFINYNFFSNIANDFINILCAFFDSRAVH